MSRRNRLAGLILLAVCAAMSTAAPSTAEAQCRGVGQPSDWGRFYYYPYVYYPENFKPLESYDNMCITGIRRTASDSGLQQGVAQ